MSATPIQPFVNGANGKGDPTSNVLLLVDAAVERLDDLRAAETRRINELMALHSEHAKDLNVAEAKRIDAIRVVDVNAVAVASERAAAQAAVLATQVVQSAEALRALVATTADTIAKQLSGITSQLIERLAALEKAQYEGVGKERISDPMITDLLREVKSLRESRSEGTGKSTGANQLWGFIVGGLGIMVAILSFALRLGGK